MNSSLLLLDAESKVVTRRFSRFREKDRQPHEERVCYYCGDCR